MADHIFRKKLDKSVECSFSTSLFGRGKAAKLALLAAFFGTLTTLSAEAALFGLGKSNKNKKQETESVQLRIDNSYQEQRNITGSNLDAYNFAQTHFGQSKSKLEQVCRAISSQNNDNAARDILQKVYVIDTQIYMQNIKNSAMSVREILQANTNINQGLQDLRQIIMSPGSQTLESLDKTIDKVRAINGKQLLTSQKYLSCLENIIEMAKASYETYELIPSLNINELDMFVQASKQLMTNIRSHSESFKGLVLNVKSSSEQIDNGLTSIKQTIKETLRFSDHFAIKQFPLINLPTPSREKIFVQVNSLSNTVKGVENTVQIGDSQVRNTAQQFSHLVTSFVAKSAESMKYNKAEYREKAQTQISSYARNQVCGLFARIKEDMGNMRNQMAEAGKANGNLQPIVNMESRSEYVARKAKSAAEEKLPLFLLGGKGGSSSSNSTTIATAKKSQPLIKPMTMKESNFDGFMPLEEPKGKSQVLFSEKDFASAQGDDSGFMTSEMNILQQELGSDFFFGDSGENISGSSLLANADEDLPNFGVDDDSYSDKDSAEIEISYSNLEKDSDPEVEMLRFDSSSLDSGEEELLPMMKYDSDVLNFDELNE